MTAIIDASALMALMLGEEGSDLVAAVIRNGLISAVNVSECCSRGMERGANAAAVLAIIQSYEVVIVPFELTAALDAARLRELTRPVGASLGDRACLALGLRRGLPIFTSDRRLAEIDPALGLDIRLIR